jgi:transposase InsO family protein
MAQACLREGFDESEFARRFHSDNGSEFINHTAAKLLNKLLIEQTKSRPRHSNDNGLVESKNGAIARKRMRYTHIASPEPRAPPVRESHTPMRSGRRRQNWRSRSSRKGQSELTCIERAVGRSCSCRCNFHAAASIQDGCHDRLLTL